MSRFFLIFTSNSTERGKFKHQKKHMEHHENSETFNPGGKFNPNWRSKRRTWLHESKISNNISSHIQWRRNRQSCTRKQGRKSKAKRDRTVKGKFPWKKH